MKIKKFVARDYQTAIKLAKEEMGMDAIILHSRPIKRNALFSRFMPNQVEITVAIDDTIQVSSDLTRKIPLPKTEIEPAFKPPLKENRIKEPELIEEIKRMNLLMSEMRSKLYEVELMRGLSEQVQLFYNALIRNNVNHQLALQIATSVESRLPRDYKVDNKWTMEVCLHTLREYLQDVSPIELVNQGQATLVFLVGPTGVGKTTTIAKLAANMTLLEGKKAALITLDTYRISAADQLRTFAEITGIPISVVFSPVEFMEALAKYKDLDIVFVDTAGRSPYNQEQLEELKQYVEIARPDETILVLSVTTDTNELIAIFNRFEPVGIDKVIFTKIDETFSYGQILNAIYEIKKPIAYITNGQSVPDDIEVPDALNLARLLLGKEEIL
ncbi:MAG: flagellar biosynthesis protein FlhF [Syntrophomonadaceae bacterium]|nr:flagellar biosynthesis protein FlhF [Syntrophomonadaceae bacterium]